MKKPSIFLRWIPALLVMGCIFAFSSIPSENMPDLGYWEDFIRKGGHVLGYAILGLAFFYAIGANSDQQKIRSYSWAFVLSLLYAISDEFHQSIIPGRHSTWVDVVLFDGGGAAIALGLLYSLRARKHSLNQKV